MLNFLFGTTTHWWFWIALIFLFIEIETWGLYSVWFFFGSLAALVISLFIPSVLVQSVVFLGVSLILMISLRHYAVHKFRNGSGKQDNITELLQQPARVLTDIASDESGDVKLQGKIFNARSASGINYAVGDVPKILRIEGNTLILE